jgi:hypothetical protein
MKKTNPRLVYESSVIAKATSFSAVIGMGSNRKRIDSLSLEDAKKAAHVLIKCTTNLGKDAMVYAGEAYVGKVNSKGIWQERSL